MGMNNRLLRPISAIVAAVVSFLMSTISGDTLITQSGDYLRSIQDG